MPWCPGAQLEVEGRGSPRNLELHQQQDKDNWYCRASASSVLQLLARGVNSQGLMAFLGPHNPFLVLGMFAPCRSSQQFLAILEQLLFLKVLLD